MEHKQAVAKPISRGALIGGALSLGFASTVNIAKAATLKSILIAEPVHSVGYLPLYMAIDQGLFAKRGLDVKTLNASGGAHVTALVSGQVWGGNIGGPESCAMANVGKTDPLTSMCNVVNRSMNWMMAKKGMAPKSSSNADLAALMKGKKIALSRYGGTPDVCGRWLLKKVGLDPKTDVQIVNQSDLAAAPLHGESRRRRHRDRKRTADYLRQAAGHLGRPVLFVPVARRVFVFGHQRPQIDDDERSPDDAGVYRRDARGASPHVYEPRHGGSRRSQGISDVGRRRHQRRARQVGFYNDHIWSRDGLISARGFALDMDVVYTAGEFNTPVAFSSVIDMEFVIKSKVGKA